MWGLLEKTDQNSTIQVINVCLFSLTILIILHEANNDNNGSGIICNNRGEEASHMINLPELFFLLKQYFGFPTMID